MKDITNKKFWQKVSGAYGPFMKKNNRMYEEICENMYSDLNTDMNVLELACGTGQLSFRVSEAVNTLEATDFSENMIKEVLKNKIPGNLHFSVQDATNLPYGPETFDAVVIANALHIMPCPEKALEEIKRVLKPEGLLFAPTFVQAEGKNSAWKTRLLEAVGFRTYHKWNAGDLLSFVSEHGFYPVKHKMIGSGLLPSCYLMAKKKV